MDIYKISFKTVNICITIILVIATACRSINASNESAVSEFMQEGNIPGLFLAVVKSDSVLYSRGFGIMDIESKNPLTGNTPMEIGSISKAFTAEAIIELVHQKRIRLTDPITKYIKNAPDSWNQIQINHLLTHSSGIQNYLNDPRFLAEKYFMPKTGNLFNESTLKEFTADTLLKMFYSLPLEFAPGQNWSYSNTGYVLLGHIIESITGEDYFDYTQSILMVPAGMRNTKSNNKASLSGNKSKGYIHTATGLREAMILDDEYAFSAGTWSVTGEDFIKYLKAFHKKKLPSDQAGYDWYLDTHSEHPYSYNGGRFFHSYRGRHYVYHNGGTPGFSSSWIHNTEDTISVIIMINIQDYAPIDQLAHKIMTHYVRDSSFPTKRVKTLESELWEGRISGLVDSILSNKNLPDICTYPLMTFLNSENGKGLWNWFFANRIPESFECIDIDESGPFTQYYFRIRSKDHQDFTVTAMINDSNKLMRLIWF